MKRIFTHPFRRRSIVPLYFPKYYAAVPFSSLTPPLEGVTSPSLEKLSVEAKAKKKNTLFRVPPHWIPLYSPPHEKDRDARRLWNMIYKTGNIPNGLTKVHDIFFSKISPNFKTSATAQEFSIILQQCESTEESLRILDIMERCGVTPDASCLLSVMASCVVEGHFDKAEEIKSQLVAVQPWVDTSVRSLLNPTSAVLVRHRRFQDLLETGRERQAYELYERLFQRDLKFFSENKSSEKLVDIKLCTIFMTHRFRTSSAIDALNVIRNAEERLGLSLDRKGIDILATMLVIDGYFEEAFQLVKLNSSKFDVSQNPEIALGVENVENLLSELKLSSLSTIDELARQRTNRLVQSNFQRKKIFSWQRDIISRNLFNQMSKISSINFFHCNEISSTLGDSLNILQLLKETQIQENREMYLPLDSFQCLLETFLVNGEYTSAHQFSKILTGLSARNLYTKAMQRNKEESRYNSSDLVDLLRIFPKMGRKEIDEKVQYTYASKNIVKKRRDHLDLLFKQPENGLSFKAVSTYERFMKFSGKSYDDVFHPCAHVLEKKLIGSLSNSTEARYQLNRLLLNIGGEEAALPVGAYNYVVQALMIEGDFAAAEVVGREMPAIPDRDTLMYLAVCENFRKENRNPKNINRKAIKWSERVMHRMRYERLNSLLSRFSFTRDEGKCNPNGREWMPWTNYEGIDVSWAERKSALSSAWDLFDKLIEIENIDKLPFVHAMLSTRNCMTNQEMARLLKELHVKDIKMDEKAFKMVKMRMYMEEENFENFDLPESQCVEIRNVEFDKSDIISAQKHILLENCNLFSYYGSGIAKSTGFKHMNILRRQSLKYFDSLAIRAKHGDCEAMDALANCMVNCGSAKLSKELYDRLVQYHSVKPSKEVYTSLLQFFELEGFESSDIQSIERLKDLNVKPFPGQEKKKPFHFFEKSNLLNGVDIRPSFQTKISNFDYKNFDLWRASRLFCLFGGHDTKGFTIEENGSIDHLARLEGFNLFHRLIDKKKNEITKLQCEIVAKACLSVEEADAILDAFQKLGTHHPSACNQLAMLYFYWGEEGKVLDLLHRIKIEHGTAAICTASEFILSDQDRSSLDLQIHPSENSKKKVKQMLNEQRLFFLSDMLQASVTKSWYRKENESRRTETKSYKYNRGQMYAQEILENLKEKNLTNLDIWNLYLRNSKCIFEARKLFEQIRLHQCEPNEESWNALLDRYLCLEKFENSEFFENLQSSYWYENMERARKVGAILQSMNIREIKLNTRNKSQLTPKKMLRLLNVLSSDRKFDFFAEPIVAKIKGSSVSHLLDDLKVSPKKSVPTTNDKITSPFESVLRFTDDLKLSEIEENEKKRIVSTKISKEIQEIHRAIEEIEIKKEKKNRATKKINNFLTKKLKEEKRKKQARLNELNEDIIKVETKRKSDKTTQSGKRRRLVTGSKLRFFEIVTKTRNMSDKNKK
eukprot:g2938.t1